MPLAIRMVVLVAAAAAASCHQGGPASAGGGTGGRGATGGTTETGGSTATGSGGAASAGGVIGSSGTSGSGGSGVSTASGGVRGTGGTAASSGATATGGAPATGGTPATGGASATGGTNGSGGTPATGGALGQGAGGQASDHGGGGAASGGGGAGGSGVSGGESPLLAPSSGALLGAFVGTGTVAQLETTLGRKLAIIHNFFGWTDDFVPWIRSSLQTGELPLVTWETWMSGVGVPLDDIVNGVHDTMIRARAQAAKDIGQRFFLRWGHEMNGNWYPWDGFHNGANAAATAKYVAVYRHIHDLFTSVGASNVLWVFCPNVDSVPGDAWNQWSNYYPGDSYVDWMGFDGYNWGTVLAGGTWRSFADIVGTVYAGMAAKGKPIMLPETASTELGGDKAAWITAMLPSLRASYPSIKALVWFHMNKETDWRVDSSTSARDAFVPMAADPYFKH